MKLYYAIWHDKSVTVLHAKSDVEAFFELEEEASPYGAKVWCAKGKASITSEIVGDVLVLKGNGSGWKRVRFPDVGTIYGSLGGVE